MKKFIAAVLLMLCFGIAKAHMPNKIHPAFTQKKFVVTGINHLKNYNVPFKVNRNLVITALKKSKIEFTVNILGVEVGRTQIESSAVVCLRFAQGKRTTTQAPVFVKPWL